MQRANVKIERHCAFCKYWYDPTNSAIVPKMPNMGIWEFDSNAKNKCLKTNIEKRAASFCSKYESKIN